MSLAQDILRLMSDGKERSSLDITTGLFPELKGSDFRNKRLAITTILSKMKRRGDMVQTRREWMYVSNTKVSVGFWRRNSE